MRARLAALLALATALGGAAPAAADGPSTPFLVAHGTSPHGMPWRIRMGEERFGGPQPVQATLWFSLGRPGECEECGYFSTFPLPVPRSYAFHFVPGSDLGTHSEADVSGTAGTRVARLVATMSDGSALEIETQLAPSALRDRFRWLRRLRFFDAFFPEGSEPVAISAYGRDGHLLDRQPA